MNPLVFALALAALLTVLPLAPSRAQSSLGAGNTPCGQFLRAGRSSDILYHQASNWLLGYVAAMNAASSASPTKDLTGDQVLKAAGDYCAANPSSTVAHAAGQWYAALPKQSAAPEQRSWMLDLNKRPTNPGGPKP